MSGIHELGLRIEFEQGELDRFFLCVVHSIRRQSIRQSIRQAICHSLHQLVHQSNIRLERQLGVVSLSVTKLWFLLMVHRLYKWHYETKKNSI